VHPHLAGNMGKYPMTIVKFHLEHGIGQGLDYRTFYLYSFFLSYTSSSVPSKPRS
jgi:hypothetical protein